ETKQCPPKTHAFSNMHVDGIIVGNLEMSFGFLW